MHNWYYQLFIIHKSDAFGNSTTGCAVFVIKYIKQNHPFVFIIKYIKHKTILL